MPSRERRLREEREEELYGPTVTQAQIDAWMENGSQVIAVAIAEEKRGIAEGRYVRAKPANFMGHRFDPEEFH